MAPAPAALRGHVTFGSFNRQDKVHPALIGCWARILRSVPGARLLLKNRALQIPAVRAALVAAFAREGVPAAIGWAVPENESWCLPSRGAASAT